MTTDSQARIASARRGLPSPRADVEPTGGEAPVRLPMQHRQSFGSEQGIDSLHDAIMAVLVKRLSLDRAVTYAVDVLAKESDWHGVIKLVIEVAGIPQAEIARTLQVERSTVARWAVGASSPADYLLISYAKVLNRSIESDGLRRVAGMAHWRVELGYRNGPSDLKKITETDVYDHPNAQKKLNFMRNGISSVERVP